MGLSFETIEEISKRLIATNAAPLGENPFSWGEVKTLGRVGLGATAIKVVPYLLVVAVGGFALYKLFGKTPRKNNNATREGADQ